MNKEGNQKKVDHKEKIELKISDFRNEYLRQKEISESQYSISKLEEQKSRIEREIEIVHGELKFLSKLIDEPINMRLRLILRNPISVLPVIWTTVIFFGGLWKLLPMFLKAIRDFNISGITHDSPILFMYELANEFTDLYIVLLLAIIWFSVSAGFWFTDDLNIRLKCVTDKGLFLALENRQESLSCKEGELSSLLEEIATLQNRNSQGDKV